MRRLSAVRRVCAFAAVAALAPAGCVYVGGASGIPGPPGPPGPPGMMARPQVGLGVSAGPLMAKDEWLDTGMYLGVHAGVWLNEYFAVEVSGGSATLTDNGAFAAPDPMDPAIPYGGELTVTPLTVCVVMSVPDPTMPEVRFRVGVGFGSAGLSHPEFEVSAIPITVFQVGGEFLVPMTGGTGTIRVFAIFDAMLGEVVEENDPVDPDDPAWWDLEAITVARIGMQMTF